ncbi:replication initiation/membrane attachment protein [Streptococcus cuniculi]|uniref:Replication initiation/membrane attachment protein n=1 Tax=Streptococcus cuniculi TaxID=1432788 RepID=A0A4Y9JB27_9STRE|nr:replication initiation/membrane attachment protein [Streptococcus cuniculi]MBF0778016.1 replication initiation/membrane attachment protein [Streptococcus cuniculi]TFU98027.1 replication initiation/membrane attachment protein [Streptococcus cuniculi]
MKPNDLYSYMRKNALSPNWLSFILCYQPIIGQDAATVYQFLWAGYDHGAGQYAISRILNHVNMGMGRLEQALDVLGAMGLLAIYQKDEKIVFRMAEPLSKEAFLSNPLYQKLLTKKIGEPAVEEWTVAKPVSDTEVTKKFSDIFTSLGEVPLAPLTARSFDLQAFQTMMARDRLRFQNETDDVIALYHLAEKNGWDWMQAYKVAKETANGQVILVKRMEQKVVARPVAASLTKQEQAIVRESQSKTALEFLTLLKEARKATVTMSERKCLQQLVDLGLLDEVINVIVLYTFNKVDSANLQEAYALKLGNDFSYKQIKSAEQAVYHLRESKAVGRKKDSSQAKKSNVPEWSKQEVKTEQTAQGQAELAALYRELEAMETKGEG